MVKEEIEGGILGFGIITGKYLFTAQEKVKNLRKRFSE